MKLINTTPIIYVEILDIGISEQVHKSGMLSFPTLTASSHTLAPLSSTQD